MDCRFGFKATTPDCLGITSEERGPAFYASPDKLLKIRRNLVGVAIQHYGHGDRREIIAPDISTLFWRIVRVWVCFLHTSFYLYFLPYTKAGFNVCVTNNFRTARH